MATTDLPLFDDLKGRKLIPTFFSLKGGLMPAKKIVITTIIAVIAATVLITGCRHRSPEERAERLTDKIASELDLNAAQKDQLNRFKNELVAKGLRMREKRDRFKNELITQIKSDTFDPAPIEALISEHKKDMDDMLALILKQMTEFHGTLTPEQKAKLVAKVERFDRCGKHRCPFSRD
jgi:Spy/CpxP family protein refolding chaperone